MSQVNDPIALEELERANAIRKEYVIPGSPDPYMMDIIRAFRLAKNASIYIEVGTQDKGNIAWVARSKLAPGATIIDIDLVQYPDNDRRIEHELRAREFDYHKIRADCLTDETLNEVHSILNGRKADLIFCDSHYTYEHALTEFARYFPVVKEGGFFFFHDALWPGDENSVFEEERKIGKRVAIEQIDRFHPTYIVEKGRPLYRYTPPTTRDKFWGTVAIIPA